MEHFRTRDIHRRPGQRIQRLDRLRRGGSVGRLPCQPVGKLELLLSARTAGWERGIPRRSCRLLHLHRFADAVQMGRFETVFEGSCRVWRVSRWIDLNRLHRDFVHLLTVVKVTM